MSKKLTGVLKEQVDLVFGLMQKHGVKTITVSFDGCGDSGQISNVAVDPEGSPILDVEVKYRVSKWNWVQVQGGKMAWEETTEPATSNVDKLVSDLVYDLLEMDHGGWELDSGSFGEFTFDSATLRLNVEFNQRTESYDTSTYELE